MYDKAPFLQPDQFNNVLQSDETRRQVLTVEQNHVFNPTLMNTVRFGWSHIYAASPGSATAINPAAASTDPTLSFIPGQTPGTVDLSASGVSLLNSGLSTATPAFFAWNSYQIYDNVFLTKGIHSLKFGDLFQYVTVDRVLRCVLTLQRQLHRQRLQRPKMLGFGCYACFRSRSRSRAGAPMVPCSTKDRLRCITADCGR